METTNPNIPSDTLPILERVVELYESMKPEGYKSASDMINGCNVVIEIRSDGEVEVRVQKNEPHPDAKVQNVENLQVQTITIYKLVVNKVLSDRKFVQGKTGSDRKPTESDHKFTELKDQYTLIFKSETKKNIIA